jgi:hypothetical protein
MIGLVMARANLPAKKYKKSNPTQIRLSFEARGSGTEFIDIAKALSAVNRKFYRQGVYYHVNSIEIYNNETGVIDIHTLPDTWVTKNAWNRGFQLFQKMNALTDPPLSGGLRPKYHDFKVFMNSRHFQGGSLQPSLHDINNSATEVDNDEWLYSRFVSADDDGDSTQEADDFYVHMLGQHAGTNGNWESVGLIKSYAESRRTVPSTDQQDNNVTEYDPLLNVFDMSSEEQMNDIIQNLNTDNDAPPYNQNNYVGETTSSLQHVARIGTEQGVGRIGRAAGFCAPFGLICIDPFGVSSDYRVVLNLAPGTYHGVYAERA